MQICTSCKECLPLSFFYKDSRPGRTHRHNCIECTKRDVRERQRAVKARAVEYKGGACEHCGGVFHQAVYDFHHKDPTEKDFGIGSYRRPKQWESLKEELDKCLMLCANCHRMEHHNEQA